MTLSDLQIKKTAPQKARFEISDGKGLSLRIMPTGKKTWVFRYMIDGKARRMTLGTYPSVSLSGAREKHSLAMQEVERGIDPGYKQTAEEAARKAAPTVADLLEEFWEIVLKHKASGNECKRLLVKDVIPLWGERKVVSITRRDAVLLIDKVRARAAITANRLQGVLVQMFNFAAERGIMEHYPLAGLKKKSEKARSRVLTDDEIRLLWAALDLENKVMDIYPASKLAMKMILLTGQRPGEACGMAWSEIDSDGFWNIPAERRKSRDAQRIPLSEMAMQTIEQARIYSGDSPFVFSSTRKNSSPVMTHTLSKAIVRHWREIGFKEPFTPHDLRRTLRTRLAEIGVDDVVAERVLGHKLQGIMAVYNRHSYDTEKRLALDKWERKLRKILGIESNEGGKVIQLKRFASR
jgi:integrase